MEPPQFKLSHSLIKVLDVCPFHAYCKITHQEVDEGQDNKYGDAGNLVHTTIEYYYHNLEHLNSEFAMVELKNKFDADWEQYNFALNKDDYWICVINAINRKISATDYEYLIEFDSPFPFKGYIDMLNQETKTIGDWKTANYKSKKLEEYRDQMKLYSLACFKVFNFIPDWWIFFNRDNRMFTGKYTKEELAELQVKTTAKYNEVLKRFKEENFPRNSDRNNCFFCSYKNVCKSDLFREDNKEKFVVNFCLQKNKLLIEGNIPDTLHKEIEAHCNFEVKNAHFIKQAMLMKGVRYDGIKRLYHPKPFGAQTFIGYMNFCYKTIKKYCEEHNLKLDLTIKDTRNNVIMDSVIDNIPEKLNIPFELYEFQKDAVNELIRYRWGVCEIGTGGGKTAIAAECIRKLYTKTLFIIDNKDLLMQTKAEYENMLGVEVGVVGMGQRDWKDITLSTIQTLNKHVKEFAHELSKINLVIYDETHIIAADSFVEISKYLVNTKYRFGFSATARRDDWNDNIIFAHTGEVVYKKKADALIEEGILVNPQIKFVKYVTKACTTDDWNNEFESNIIQNPERNALIKLIVDKYNDKQIMILSKRIEHCKMLSELLNAELIYGQTEDDIRVDILEKFKNKEIRLLVGNLSIFNKGINIPSLDIVINASGNAGDVLTIQTIGRALRKSLGKETAIYFDFIDKGNYCFKHSISRLNALRSEKYRVDIINESEV